MAVASVAVAIAGFRLSALLPDSHFPSTTSTSTPVLQSRFPFCSSSYLNNSTPKTECPVPLDQLPVNEYQTLTTSLPFSWAAGHIKNYCSSLAFTGASFALFIGLPVAAFGKRYVVADPQVERVKVALGATSSGILAVTLAVLRMLLGLAYVGNRLQSATV